MGGWEDKTGVWSSLYTVVLICITETVGNYYNYNYYSMYIYFAPPLLGQRKTLLAHKGRRLWMKDLGRRQNMEENEIVIQLHKHNILEQWKWRNDERVVLWSVKYINNLIKLAMKQGVKKFRCGQRMRFRVVMTRVISDFILVSSPSFGPKKSSMSWFMNFLKTRYSLSYFKRDYDEKCEEIEGSWNIELYNHQYWIWNEIFLIY